MLCHAIEIDFQYVYFLDFFFLVTLFLVIELVNSIYRDNLLVYFLVFLGICSGKKGENFEKLKNAVARINLFVLSRS